MTLSKLMTAAAVGAIAAFVGMPAMAQEAAGHRTGQLPTPVARVARASIGSSNLNLVSGLDADWVGALDMDGHKLHLVLHVLSQAGSVSASLDSTDQGAFDLPVSGLERSGDKVSFKVAAVGASFAGDLSAGGQSLSGTFTQGGHDLPLALDRKASGSAATRLYRPQEEAIAATPASYRQEMVAIGNPAATGVRLSGTLTLPKGPGPFPAVVLVVGSGPLDRNEEVFKHKVFFVLADYLTRRGIAVLRYDKRGVAQSTGDYKAATTVDFASDAEAVITYLRGRSDIIAGKVGVIGHSEGGIVGPMVAAHDPKLAFVVMLAGTGVPGAVLLPEQDRLVSLADGGNVAKVQKDFVMETRAFKAIADAKDANTAQADVRRIMGADSGKPTSAEIEQMVHFAGQPWIRYILRYDPAQTLRKIRIPVLALDGEKDLQVPPRMNLPPIRAALAQNRDATVIEMPGLNHLFQHARTGSPTEYGLIEETLSPELLTTVFGWVEKHTE